MVSQFFPVRTQPCSWLLHHVYFIRKIRGSWSCLRKLRCIISCWFVARNAAAVSTSEWQRASCWALARSEPPLVRKLRRHKKLKIQAFYTCHQFLFLFCFSMISEDIEKGLCHHHCFWHKEVLKTWNGWKMTVLSYWEFCVKRDLLGECDFTV